MAISNVADCHVASLLAMTSKNEIGFGGLRQKTPNPPYMEATMCFLHDRTNLHWATRNDKHGECVLRRHGIITEMN